MCAINGFTSEDKALVERMNAATAHRGPDGNGVLIRDGVSFGHNRLSILDLSPAAGQPMLSPDGRYAITYNGEIYNFKELRAELKGHAFKTEGDTEVILAAYARWGRDAFRKLDGIFALALHDRATGAVTLARDRAGVKPLYYAVRGGTLVFSSEIKGLAAYGITRELSLDAFDLYLRLGYVPGTASALTGVNRLPAGTYGTWEEGTFRIQSFVPPDPLPEERMRFEEAKHLVESSIDASVKHQLISDRPLGIYLSGGIDSSVVLDAASRLRPGIDTFSVGFALGPNEEPEKFNADARLAERTAAHYGARHHAFSIEPAQVLPTLLAAARQLDEPIANPTVVPMLFLAERTKEAGIDVVLTGDGGDEVFGGYERYRWSVRSDAFRSLPGFMRRLLVSAVPQLRKLDDEPGVARYARFHFQKEGVVREVTGSAYRDGAQAIEGFAAAFLGDDGSPLDAFMRADRSFWLVDESLHRSDRLSMAYGVEARVPFLGASVLESAPRIPARFKTTLFDTKVVLKEAFRDRLPPYLLSQPKRGWQSPGAKWIRYPHIREFAESVLAPGYHRATDPLFDWEAVARMLEDHVSGDRYNLTMLWNLLAFRLWAKECDVTV